MSDRPKPIVYTQNGCVESHKVREWLANRGVDFDERNVTGDADATAALDRYGADQGVEVNLAELDAETL